MNSKSKGRKAWRYAFFSISAVATIFFAVLLISSFAVFPVEKVNACCEPPTMYLPPMPDCDGNFGRIIAVSNPATFYGGYNYDETPEHYIVDPNATSTYGDSLDWYWVQEWSPYYIEWDLEQLVNQVRIFPSQDHGPYPAEFQEYDVKVSPDKTSWLVMASSTTYVGDLTNIKVHDGVQDYSAATTFRYVRIAPNAAGGGDYEIDAVRGCNITVPVNNPPVIMLVGSSTIVMNVGDSYIDPGATATDTEDGNITGSVVASSTINTAVAGTYTVTYNVTDSKGLAAVPVLRTVTVTPVLLAPFCGDGICNGSESCGACSDCGSCSYGGGDGGGGGGSVPIGNGPPEFSALPSVVNTPIETAPAQCNYLLEYLKLGADNNPVEVYKLQIFLKNFEGFNDLQMTGIFDQPTFDAVSAFQEKYKKDILEPWSHENSTGYVYITTKKKVNEIYCRREFPLTDLQNQEIIAFRNLVESLRRQGVVVPETGAEEISGEIGRVEKIQPPKIAEVQKEEQGFSTSTLVAGMSLAEIRNVLPSVEVKNEFQKSIFSAALAYFSGLNLLPSLLLFFLLLAIISLFLLLQRCKREKIYLPTVLPFGDE